MKRALIFTITILSVFAACLVTAYASNEANISKFNEGKYQKNAFAILGFTQPYVNPYNQGNAYFKQGEYDLAIEEYDKALGYNPTHPTECKIRINKVLALLARIDFDSINKSNVDEVLAIIDEAKEILSEEGCANPSFTGHNEDANQLYKELCEMEEELKNQNNSGEDKDGDQDEEPEDNNDNNDDNEGQNDAKVQEILDNQNKGLDERNTELRDRRYLYSDYDYYEGIIW